MAATLPPLFRGAEAVYTASIVVDGVPLDLTGYTLRAELWWSSRAQLTFDVDDGLEILELAPATPGEGEQAAPQYQVRISEAQSLTLPLNREAYFKHIRIDTGGVTTIRGPFYLPVLP